jgi:hypothetical protein
MQQHSDTYTDPSGVQRWHASALCMLCITTLHDERACMHPQHYCMPSSVNTARATVCSAAQPRKLNADVLQCNLTLCNATACTPFDVSDRQLRSCRKHAIFTRQRHVHTLAAQCVSTTKLSGKVSMFILRCAVCNYSKVTLPLLLHHWSCFCLSCMCSHTYGKDLSNRLT